MPISIYDTADRVAQTKMKEILSSKTPSRTLSIVNDDEVYSSFLKQDISEDLKKKKFYPRYLTGILFKRDGVYVGIIKNSKDKTDLLYECESMMLNKLKLDKDLFSFDIFAIDEYGSRYVSHSSIIYGENSFLSGKIENYFFYADIISSNSDENVIFEKFQKHLNVLAKMYSLDKLDKFDNLNNWLSFCVFTSKLNNGTFLEVAKTFEYGRVPYYPKNSRITAE